jgi:outer membrane protein OmpU
MNKLRTIGLSALAGSLAAFSAQAFEASVSGGAEITMSHLGGGDVTGNPLGARKNITFSGSGELDNGWGISVFHALGDTGAFGSSVYSFDMGSIGTVSLDSGSGGHGAASIDNVMPTAYEEADYGFATGANDIGGTASGEYIGYSNSVGGATIVAAYNPDRGGGTSGDGGTGGGAGAGAAWDLGVKLTPMDGMLIVAGWGQLDNGTGGTSNIDEDTIGVTYAMGAITVGAQLSHNDVAGGTENTTEAFGITFNVSDNLSIGYQRLSDEYNRTGPNDTDTTFNGLSAAYSMGNIAIKFVANDVSNLGGTQGTSDEAKELSLSFAF